MKFRLNIWRTQTVKNSLFANGLRNRRGGLKQCAFPFGEDSQRGQKSRGVIHHAGSRMWGTECSLENVIIDKYCHIREGRHLAGSVDYPIVIRKGSVVLRNDKKT